jgi:multicomponent Na+:H+ antiporter subunit G
VNASLLLDLVAATLIVGGAFFFLAGTVGLLRFPDVYCCLHALTKADTLGLGLLGGGLALRAEGWAARAQIGVTWLLALAAAATVCHLLARTSIREGVPAVTSGGEPVDPRAADPRPTDHQRGGT